MNKKVMILVVILECALSILLISVVGMAIETLNNETEAVDIRFTTAEGVLLEPGMLYKEKEGTTEEIKNDQLVIEVYRPDRGYQLHWEILAENASDRSVSFLAISHDPAVEVTVDESGYVHFDDEVEVTVIISTKNGRTATALLIPRQKEKSGNVTLE